MRIVITIVLVVLGLVDSGTGVIQGVRRWAVQLQGVDLPAIVAAEDFDLVVIDYSHGGGKFSEWTPEEIDAIRQSGKIPVAYLSIGEAETYRWYWQSEWETDPPSWLGPVNPNWPDNYKVRFWDDEWKTIVFAYVDKVLAQGFDGLYLDVVDAYYYWLVENPENPQADVDMVQFILALRAYVTSAGRPDLLLFQQNAESIIFGANVQGALADDYLGSVDALSSESLFHYGPLDVDNPWNPDSYRINRVLAYLEAGLSVFSIEYLTDAASRDFYYDTARTLGFHPFATTPVLNSLQPQPTIDVGSALSPWRCGAVRPNPAQGLAFLPVHAPEDGGDAVLELYDLRGRLVARRLESVSGGGALLGVRPPSSRGVGGSGGIYTYRLLHAGRLVDRGKISFVR